MATKQWTHLKLKNGDEVQWIPPAPNGANRGGVTTAEMNAKQNATDNALNTTNKTVVGAINEHESDISTLSNDIANKQDKLTAGTNITIDSTTDTISATIPNAAAYVTGGIRIYPAYCLTMSGAVLICIPQEYQAYVNMYSQAFISKGTLENVANARGWCTAIKTTMDNVAVANAQYYLGEQTTLTISMPTNATVGQSITVVFSSGATACTLTCDLQGFDFVPKANKTNKIVFTFIGSDKWAVEVEES